MPAIEASGAPVRLHWMASVSSIKGCAGWLWGCLRSRQTGRALVPTIDDGGAQDGSDERRRGLCRMASGPPMIVDAEAGGLQCRRREQLTAGAQGVRCRT